MKRFHFEYVYVGFVMSILLLMSCKAKEPDHAVSRFEKSNEIVLNPGQGWIIYEPYEDRFDRLASNPSAANIEALRNMTAHGVKYGDVLDLGTTGYNRYWWRGIQTGENTYNWSEIDRDIAKWAAVGKKYAFGVTSISTHSTGTYTFTDAFEIAGVSGAELNVTYLCPLPTWLIRKGIKFTIENAADYSKVSKIIVPVWDDPIYVAECAKFAQVLADRYDGNPNIAFIDIRTYGNWGEMHMYPFFERRWQEYAGHLTDAQVQSLLLQPYINAFKKTQLVVCGGAPPLTDNLPVWAVNNGVGLRFDSFMCEKDDGGKFDDAYGVSTLPAVGKMPNVWEMFKFKELYDSGDWDNAPARGKMTGDQAFLKAIRDNKPNYIGMGQWDDDAQYMLSKKRELVREAAKLIGYYFSMTKANYTNEISNGEAQKISLTIKNSGVTTMLTGCVIKLVLLNGDDEVVSSFRTDWDAKSIQGGTTVTFKANVVFADAPVGTCKLAVGLYRYENDQKPTYNMDNKARTPNGFYVIGNLKIK